MTLWNFMNTHWLVFVLAFIIAPQPTIFNGSCLYLLQLLTSGGAWTLLIMESLCWFCMVSNLLLLLCRPRVPVPWTVFFHNFTWTDISQNGDRDVIIWYWGLSHCGLVPPYGVSLVQLMVWFLFGNKPLLKQMLTIISCTLRNKFEWKFNQNMIIFIQENGFENIFCKMSTILSQPQCIKRLEQVFLL